MRILASPLTLLLCLVCGFAAQGRASNAVEGTTAASDGVSLAYDVRGQGDTALVFVHCWACDRSFWREQLDAFAAEYKVVALDLPGHGASGADREAWSIAGLGGDVSAVVEALGLESVILVGHSMGGPVALEAARLMPERVRGVVCADTLHDAELVYPEEMAEQMATTFETDFQGTLDRTVGAMFPEGADPSLLDWVITRASACDETAVVALLRDFANVDLKRSLSAAGVPIRCVNAAPHPPMGTVTAVATNQKYADFDATLMEGVGHYLMLERPQEFNTRLREALAELVP